MKKSDPRIDPSRRDFLRIGGAGVIAGVAGLGGGGGGGYGRIRVRGVTTRVIETGAVLTPEPAP